MDDAVIVHCCQHCLFMWSLYINNLWVLILQRYFLCISHQSCDIFLERGEKRKKHLKNIPHGRQKNIFSMNSSHHLIKFGNSQIVWATCRRQSHQPAHPARSDWKCKGQSWSVRKFPGPSVREIKTNLFHHSLLLLYPLCLFFWLFILEPWNPTSGTALMVFPSFFFFFFLPLVQLPCAPQVLVG